MSHKKPYVIVRLDEKEANAVDIQFQDIYENKLESEFKRTSSGIERYIYQVAEHGERTFSATGSPTIVQTFTFKNKFDKIIFATAHAKNNSFIASVTDVTQSQVEITMRSISGTANFSSVSTASITCFYQVLGTCP